MGRTKKQTGSTPCQQVRVKNQCMYCAMPGFPLLRPNPRRAVISSAPGATPDGRYLFIPNRYRDQ